jgi:hypothetical protein
MAAEARHIAQILSSMAEPFYFLSSQWIIDGHLSEEAT